MVQSNGGTVTSSMVDAAGIPRAALKALDGSGRLEHVARGVYVLPDSLGDELFTLQHRYRRGVYSHATALFPTGSPTASPAGST